MCYQSTLSVDLAGCCHLIQDSHPFILFLQHRKFPFARHPFTKPFIRKLVGNVPFLVYECRPSTSIDHHILLRIKGLTGTNQGFHLPG